MNQNQTLSSLSEELQALMPDDIKKIVQNTAGNIYPEACRTARISLDGFKFNLETYQNKQERKLHNRIKAFFHDKKKVGILLVIILSLIAIVGIALLSIFSTVEGEAKIGICMPIALIMAIPIAIIWTKMISWDPSVGKGILTWFLSYVALGLVVLVCFLVPTQFGNLGASSQKEPAGNNPPVINTESTENPTPEKEPTLSGITISSVSDLQKLTNSAETYTLKNDIDLSGVSWNPIEGFSGVLDGNGYTIKNLTINKSSSNVGFFSTLSGTVKNLKFENAKIIVSGRYENVGVLCGTLTGNADTISVSGTVTASMSSNVGGVFGITTGRMYGGNCSLNLNNINNSADVSGLNKVGGVVGYVDQDVSSTGTFSLQNIVNTGKISSSGGQYVGGIVGYILADAYIGEMNVYIDQANNSGEVTGKLHVGGIIGYAQSDDKNSAISNVIVNATIKGEAYVGGVAGELIKISVKDSKNKGSKISATGYFLQESKKCAYLGGFVGRGYDASNCINEVELNYTAGGAYVGGIMGFSADGSTMSNLGNTADITGSEHVGGIIGRFSRANSNDGSSVDLQRFTNTGVIHGTDYVGGILGSCHIDVWGNTIDIFITTFKNNANITGNVYVGGIIGFGCGDSGATQSNMMDCSSTGTITGTSDYGEIAGKLENIKLQ